MSDKMYFPDEVDCAKKNLAMSQSTDNTFLEDPPEQIDDTEGNPLVSKSENIVPDDVDGQRIVFPDELQNLKNRASENIETSLQEDLKNFDVEVTNMIDGPKGQQMGADGVCRDIF